MKIGIDVSQASYGTGVSKYTYALFSHLEKNYPHEHFIPFGYSLRKKSFLKELFPNAKIWSLPPTLIEVLWNTLHIFPVEKITGSIDIYHSSDWTQGPSSAKKVTTVHDLSPFIFPAEMSSGGVRDIVSVHRRKMHWVSKECDQIIAVSNTTASDLVKLCGIPSKKITVVYEALPDGLDFTPDRQLVSDVKQRYSLDDYLITVGTLQPRKNIQFLIESYLKYRTSEKLPSKLVIIGMSGWGENPRDKSSNIVFTGFVSDNELVGLMAGSTAFVFPSLYEGFGLPTLAALRQKIPAILSQTPTLKEIAGDAAEYFDPKDEKSLIHAIKQGIAGGDSLRRRGIERLKTFSWDKTATETMDVYKSLL